MANAIPVINYDGCYGCKACFYNCPVSIFDLSHKVTRRGMRRELPVPAKIEDCIGCGVCARACPVEAITMVNQPAEEGKQAIYVDYTAPMRIDPNKCKGCTACARACPVDAIKGAVKNPHVIEEDKCVRCGLCMSKCKFDAIYNGNEAVPALVAAPAAPAAPVAPAAPAAPVAPAEPAPAVDLSSVIAPNPAAEQVAPVVEEPAPVVEPIAEPVVEEVAPVLVAPVVEAPVEEPVLPVVEEVAPVVEPIVEEPTPAPVTFGNLSSTEDYIETIAADDEPAPVVEAAPAADKGKEQKIGDAIVSDKTSNPNIAAVAAKFGLNADNLVSIEAAGNMPMVFEFLYADMRNDATLVAVYFIMNGEATLPPETDKENVLAFGRNFITGNDELKAFLA